MTTGLLHIKIRNLRLGIYNAHILRNELEKIVYKADRAPLEYTDIINYNHINDDIGKLLVIINEYFAEIRDLMVEEGIFT